MKQIIQDLKLGETLLEEVPVPAVRRGFVLIKTQCSVFGQFIIIQRGFSCADEDLQFGVEIGKGEVLFNDALFNLMCKCMI